jgi:hypothetical protein
LEREGPGTGPSRVFESYLRTCVIQ